MYLSKEDFKKYLTIENLEDAVKTAKKHGEKYMAIVIQNEGSKDSEIIINSIANYDDKLAYYKQAYDHNLVLKHCDKIKIIYFAFANTFDEIQHVLTSRGVL